MSFYDEVQLQMHVTETVQNAPPPFHTDTGTKSGTPLVNRVIDDSFTRLSCPTRKSNAALDRQRLAPSPNKHGPASYPTPYSQRRGCWEAIDWQQWKTEPLAAVTRPSHRPYRPVGTLSCWKMNSPEIARYRAASPVSAVRPRYTLHLVWCQGPRMRWVKQPRFRVQK